MASSRRLSNICRVKTVTRNPSSIATSKSCDHAGPVRKVVEATAEHARPQTIAVILKFGRPLWSSIP